MEFKVVWEIQLDADSPLDAAIEASKLMHDKSASWQFYVQDEKDEFWLYSVDLEEDDEDAVIKINIKDYISLIK